MSTPEPPPLLTADEAAPANSFLAIVLSLVLVLFLASGVISLLSDALTLFAGRSDLSAIDGLGLLLMAGAGLLTYALLAFCPGISKRLFFPVSIFVPVVAIASLPLFIYFHAHSAAVGCALSVVHVLVALAVLRAVLAGGGFRWPLVTAPVLIARPFRWGNLLGVAALGALVVIPALVAFTAFSAQLAVHHFTDGFVALRLSGVSVQVREYVRDDGKKILLVPMSHIGEPKFYHDLAASFPPDSVILMEGVTDNSKVVDQHIDYSRAAATVGGVEQVKVFRPKGEIVAADVDMSAFSPETLEVLKMAMIIHAKGVTAETLPLLSKPAPPGLELRLMADLLTMRNRHLLGVLQERLPGAQQIIVPWGAAHMPEIAREIQKLGFRVVKKQEFLAIGFGS